MDAPQQMPGMQQPPTQSQPQQEVPPQQPPQQIMGEPKRGTSLSLIVALLAIGIYAVSAFMLNLWPFQEEFVGESPIFTPRNDVLGDVYSNDLYGLEFRYPGHLEERDNTVLNESSPRPKTITFFDPIKQYALEGSTIYPSISINIIPDEFFFGSIEAYEKSLNPALPPLRQDKTEIVGGETAYVYSGVTPPVAHHFIIVFANDNVYLFSSNAEALEAAGNVEVAQDLRQTFDQILNSIVFNKVDITGWVAFPANRFGFFYPPDWSAGKVNDNSNINYSKPVLLVHFGNTSSEPCDGLGCPPKPGFREEITRGDTLEGAPPLNPWFKYLKVSGEIWISIQLTDTSIVCADENECSDYIHAVDLKNKLENNSKYSNYNKFIDLTRTLRIP